MFYAGKLLAIGVVAAVVSLGTVCATSLAAQRTLGPLATASGGETFEAAVGAVVYLTLICLFAAGLTAILRSSVATLAILMPLLFLGSQGLGNIPKAKIVLQYLPDQAGMSVMHLVGRQDDLRFARDYGPWTGVSIVALWTTAALAAGYLVLRRRDA